MHPAAEPFKRTESEVVADCKMIDTVVRCDGFYLSWVLLGTSIRSAVVSIRSAVVRIRITATPSCPHSVVLQRTDRGIDFPHSY